MFQIFRSTEFDLWLSGLRDARAKARILVRIRGAVAGNFGDCKPVGDGVSEMRIHVGAGYRVYFTRVGEIVYLLLCGGDKSSQRYDMERAKDIAREWDGPHG